MKYRNYGIGYDPNNGLTVLVVIKGTRFGYRFGVAVGAHPPDLPHVACKYSILRFLKAKGTHRDDYAKLGTSSTYIAMSILRRVAIEVKL